MAKIIYICGLGHSGSTILDLALGSHPRITGLGEIATIVREADRSRHFRSKCSCGKEARSCAFWKEAENILERQGTATEKYERIIEYFEKKYGTDHILVDSSKNSYRYLSYLDKHHELSAIYITRDFRSWAYSRHLITGLPLIYYAIRWWLENMKLLRQLKKMRITSHKVGYEELIFHPDVVMKNLFDRMELPYDDAVLQPSKSSSHIISGNIARVDPEKRRGFIYDSRWMLSSRLIYLSALTGFMNRMNRKLVYSRLLKNGIKEFPVYGSRRRKDYSHKYN